MNENPDALHREVEQLRRAMETRPVIDLARGALMASFSLNRHDAWNVLVTVSQHSNSKLHQVAEHVLGSINGEPLPQPLQKHLAAALAPFRTKPDTPPDKLNAPTTPPDTYEAATE
ncbi:ANTAR domain-containing protein [Streptomyces violascens]|uniref:ANTAR domain-containing protein n=1 Tax=Streptomyces violascens TaxID=67381 RepID=A0ABQ3QEX0_9ACTN|nr:ANTAR domain-containing protein [Streptomyces violascens]GGU46702.1 hypothetical protein GCM10010289_78970 [Streptomyces violascens]GHI35815.1 hypothetical protein Sviol_02230 [Streptomyces violascens]